MRENPSTGGDAKARRGIGASIAIASASISAPQSAVAIGRLVLSCIRIPRVAAFRRTSTATHARLTIRTAHASRFIYTIDR